MALKLSPGNYQDVKCGEKKGSHEDAREGTANCVRRRSQGKESFKESGINPLKWHKEIQQDKD